jgi:hypothetical protein
VLKICKLPALTCGCEVCGMDSTSGVKILQPVLNQCLRRQVRVGAKCPWGGHSAAIAGAINIVPIEETASTARTKVFVKASTLNMCMSDRVGQPSRMRPNIGKSGTVRWLDRFTRATAELAQGVRVPHTWRSLQPRVASNLVKAAVWGRVDTSCAPLRHAPTHMAIIPQAAHMFETHCHNTARAFPRGPF